MKTLISSEDAPITVGPYSPGLAVGEWIFLSGQGGRATREPMGRP
jgi:enamine deaminase RidA (YjgF/YER057c/UK114 family)